MTPLPPELCSELNLAIARKLQRDADTYRTVAHIFEGARPPSPPRGYKYRSSSVRFNQRIMAQARRLRARADKIEEDACQQEDKGWAFYIKT